MNDGTYIIIRRREWITSKYTNSRLLVWRVIQLNFIIEQDKTNQKVEDFIILVGFLVRSQTWWKILFCLLEAVFHSELYLIGSVLLLYWWYARIMCNRKSYDPSVNLQLYIYGALTHPFTYIYLKVLAQKHWNHKLWNAKFVVFISKQKKI